MLFLALIQPASRSGLLHYDLPTNDRAVNGIGRVEDWRGRLQDATRCGERPVKNSLRSGDGGERSRERALPLKVRSAILGANRGVARTVALNEVLTWSCWLDSINQKASRGSRLAFSLTQLLYGGLPCYGPLKPSGRVYQKVWGPSVFALSSVAKMQSSSQ